MLPMRDDQPNKRQLKIELLSQWKLEAESRNKSTPSAARKEKKAGKDTQQTAAEKIIKTKEK